MQLPSGIGAGPRNSIGGFHIPVHQPGPGGSRLSLSMGDTAANNCPGHKEGSNTQR